ncbi:MAG: hypothetical protein PUC65_13770 [Clostridiales bacterium]|nr:hypothetical protein [Clostridiales bacterium]
MEDRSQEVLQRYEFKIFNTYRTRGAYVLETDQGLKLLCAYEGSDSRLEFEDSMKQQLCMNGYDKVDLFVRNNQGTVITSNSVGEKFFIKEWFDGEECSLKKEDKILLAVRNLAKLHDSMANMQLTQEQKQCYAQSNLMVLMEKRTRELKRVKSYIRERKQKSEFEVYYLSVCEHFYKDALKAIEILRGLPYEELLTQAIEQGMVCHGSYTYHNIFILNDSQDSILCKAAQFMEGDLVATTNFEKAECGLQILDLYYFIRKAMEKNDWNLDLGLKMIEQYKSEHELKDVEQKLLYVLLLYPEKFWKITNYYYNSKKSWIPQKNVQKLQILGDQVESKNKFLRSIITS